MVEIKIYFIIPEDHHETDTSEIMQQTFELCRQNLMNVKWTPELEYDSLSLNKTDIFVFDEFIGKAFDAIQKTKSTRVVGPWCLFKCVSSNIKIPNTTIPILNLCMHNCIVSVSSLKPIEKKSIKQKVERMGGMFTGELSERNTHLITDSVKSPKYMQAVENGLKIFTPSWIEAVWEKSKTSLAHGDDAEFQNYRCKPMHKLHICCTGFITAEPRKLVERLVNENDGKYSGTLTLQGTDVLICEKDVPISQKMKAAKKANINCVTIDWLLDSIKNNCALPFNKYAIKTTSTPTKEGLSNPNFSMISAVNMSTATFQDNATQRILFDTFNTSNINTPPTNRKRKSTDDPTEYNKLVDEINMRDAKRAGQFLDGCIIYIVGFGNEQREKLIKIINGSGATRYDAHSDKITHILVGDVNCQEVNVLKTKKLHGVMVTIKWLVESVKKKCPDDETPYLIHLQLDNDAVSPLSKKSLRSETVEQHESMKENLYYDREEAEADLLQQYLQPNATDGNDSLAQLIANDMTTNQTQNTDNSSFRPDDNLPFHGLKFRICTEMGFEDHIVAQFVEGITSLGGKLAKTKKTLVDFCVVPMFIDGDLGDLNAKEIVHDLWLTECFEEKCFPEIDYFHKPLREMAVCLQNCVITTSGFTQRYERNFLKILIEKMGGVFQENFSRYDVKEKGHLASTHLICLEPTGNKYNAALKWKVPVVSRDWLLECSKQGLRVDESMYLLGKSESVSNNTPSRRSAVTTPKITPGASKTDNTTVITPKVTPGLSRTKSNTSGSASSLQNQRVQILSKKVITPANNRLASPRFDSQVTPVSKIMEDLRLSTLVKTPDSASGVFKSFNHMDTPDTPLERFLTPNTDKNLRKEVQRFLDKIPEHKPFPTRNSTPLSDLKRRLWQKIQPYPIELPTTRCDFTEQTDSAEENIEVNLKIQQLTDMIDNNMSPHQPSTSCNRRSIVPSTSMPNPIRSQVNTVTWEDDIVDNEIALAAIEHENVAVVEPAIARKCFIFSGFDGPTKEALAEIVLELGGDVSGLANFDISCTHIICAKPSRNEKLLSGMASGKWILHSQYIEDSKEAGHWLGEEEYEFGNPEFKVDIALTKDSTNRARCMHWWRLEIQRRGYGAFHDVRAIIVANNKEPLTKVIESGGGIVVDVRPPFTEDVHATHCFFELKSVKDLSDYVPLAEQGIYCLTTLYISEVLDKTVSSDPRDCVIPHFAKFYH